MGYQRRVHGSLLPLSITTNCTMKSLLIFSTLLAVGLSEPEAKAIVAPYNYGIPGYYGGVAAPFAYNNAWTAPLNYAPQTAYPYAPQTAYSYAPYAQAYAAVAAPAPVAPVNYAAFAPAPLSSQFAAGDEFGNTQYGYSNWASSKHEVGNGFGQKTGSYQYVDPNGELQTVTYVADEFGFRTEDSRLPVHNAVLPVAPVHEYILPVAPVYDGVAPIAPEKTPEVVAAEAEHLAAVAEVAASRAKRESDPMHTRYGYNSPWIVNPMYQRRLSNGIYAYNQLGYMGSSRFNYGFYY